VGILSRLFKRGEADEADAEETPISLDAAARGEQLLRLERALDALCAEMRRAQSMDNPGWRGRVNEYSLLAGEAMQLRQSQITREAVLDLVFEVRPVFSGPIPAGLEAIGPLQDDVMAATENLRQLLPSEGR
jgi:hypothetical protein